MKKYIVKENGVLIEREYVPMPMVEGDEKENEHRKAANASALARFEKMVDDGDAVEIDNTFDKDIRDCKISGKKIVEDPKKEKDRRNKEQIEKRIVEYPPAGDALDALAKWAFTETEISLPAQLKSWAAKCMSVKSKYPIDE